MLTDTYHESIVTYKTYHDPEKDYIELGVSYRSNSSHILRIYPADIIISLASNSIKVYRSILSRTPSHINSRHISYAEPEYTSMVITYVERPRLRATLLDALYYTLSYTPYYQELSNHHSRILGPHHYIPALISYINEDHHHPSVPSSYNISILSEYVSIFNIYLLPLLDPSYIESNKCLPPTKIYFYNILWLYKTYASPSVYNHNLEYILSLDHKYTLYYSEIL